MTLAIDYQLSLAATATPDDVVDVLEAFRLSDTVVHRDDERRSLDIPGLLVVTRTPAPSPFKLILNAFGFDPTLIVTFVWDRKAAYDTTATSLVRAVAALLRSLPGDAVLLANNEQPLLLRRDGRVELTTWDDWWTADRVSPPLAAQLGLAHDLRAMPVAW